MTGIDMTIMPDISHRASIFLKISSDEALRQLRRMTTGKIRQSQEICLTFTRCSPSTRKHKVGSGNSSFLGISGSPPNA